MSEIRVKGYTPPANDATSIEENILTQAEVLFNSLHSRRNREGRKLETSQDNRLLSPDDGPPVAIDNPDGKSDFLLVCEHAANRMPAGIGNLGLDEVAVGSHIPWDPGALALARALARMLDAPLVRARFSRLVYDCNRPPEAPDAMPARSEIFDVPGNADLTLAEKARRTREIYTPFTRTLSEHIASRLGQGQPTILVTLHSFTPVYNGQARTVELGILHDRDARLADALLAQSGVTPLDTRRNEPYGPEHGVTHTLQMHALPNALLNVMIEVRNDHLRTPEQQQNVARDLAVMLRRAQARTAPPPESAEPPEQTEQNHA